MAQPAVSPNSPTAGSIAWEAFSIQYLGVGYGVTAGSTSRRWVWWRFNTGAGTTVIEAGDSLPEDLKDDDLVLFRNTNGLPVRMQSSNYVDGELLVDGTILAPALGTDSVTTRAMLAGSVTADIVDSSVVIVNDFYARNGIEVGLPGAGPTLSFDEDNGFLQTFANGAARVNFPVDPNQPNVVRSQLITDGITAEGRVSLRGVDNEISRNSAVVLQVGTTPPANAPTISTGLQNVRTGLPSNSKMCRGADGASWKIITGTGENASGAQNGPTTVTTITDAGVVTTTTITGLPTGTGAVTVPTNNITDICRIGNAYYFVGWATYAGTYRVPHVVELNSSMQYVRHWVMPAPGNFSTRNCTVASDGTNLYTMAYNPNGDQSQVYRVNPTTGAVLATVTLSSPVGGLNTAKLIVGNFDFGALRYIVYGNIDPTPYNSTGAVQAGEKWSGGGAAVSWDWDGTRFWRLNAGILSRASTNKTDRTVFGAYTWYDSDPVGGNFQTTVSPIVSFIQKARYAISVTTPPPADDGTSSAPDSARFYLGTTAAALRLQGSEFLVQATFLDPNPASGVSPPTLNTFPDGVAAELRSQGGTTIIRGDGTTAVRDPIDPLEFANKRYVDAKTARQAFAISPSAALALTTTTWTQVPGASETLVVKSTTDVFLVLGSVDFDQSSATGNIARAIVGIDGTAASPADSSAQALARHSVDTGMRVTAPMFWIISNQTPGNHTLRLLASLASGTSGWSVGTQSRVQVVQVA